MKAYLKIISKTIFYMIAAIVILFLILYLLTIGNYAVPKTVADDPSLPRVVINGTLFHAETFGNSANPVVIVIHGGPGWDYQGLLPLKGLSDEYYVVFYDQRGTGLSPRVDPSELNIESSLHDLDAIVDHFGKGKKVDLIGHSWGAMLVTGYLGKHPEKVGHAVLAEPGFLTTEMMKQAGVKFWPRWEAGFLLRATKAWFQSFHIKGPDKDAASDYLLGQVAPYANPEYYCNGTIPDAGALHWRAGVQAMQAILGSAMDHKGDFHINLIKGVERFTSPVLFLTTDCNRLIGKSHQEKQAKFFPNVKIEIIKGSGHSMFSEKPAES
ncbi:MAG: alpha/beta hydrolase, partial [Candidatus Omnitrophica bacterium]|nr:alpha/beta hydrolase [Candidatus Omnitrophota bacterium]